MLPTGRVLFSPFVLPPLHTEADVRVALTSRLDCGAAGLADAMNRFHHQLHRICTSADDQRGCPSRHGLGAARAPEMLQTKLGGRGGKRDATSRQRPAWSPTRAHSSFRGTNSSPSWPIGLGLRKQSHEGHPGRPLGRMTKSANSARTCQRVFRFIEAIKLGADKAQTQADRDDKRK